MGTELRPYQSDVVQKIEDEFEFGAQKVLTVAPTGSGKTIIASEITRRNVERHRCVLFLAHRREIILQTSQKLFAAGVSHGVIMPGIDPRPMAQVQVASIQTLWSRALRSDAMKLPPADLLIIDECHHGRANTYQKVIDAYHDAALLGLTATQCRGDGRGLGNI